MGALLALPRLQESGGLVTGYASLFGVADLGGDVVAPGAFRASLARRGAAGVRMLWQHDPAQPIGRWLSIEEDARGLRVAGELSREVARARELAALIREGALDGLSIGFRAERATKDARGRRRLVSVDLWEISLVTFPMLAGARVERKRMASAASLRPAPRPASRVVWRDRAVAVLVSLDAARLDLARRYRPDQPRDEMGKWVFDGGPRRRPGAGGGGASGEPGLVIAAGGFTPEQLDMSVQLFVSAFCQGNINSVLPGQFMDWKVGDVQRLAKSGDARARTCLKLLGRPDY
ncbi:MAG: HK97 family phage prohead protease [Methylobacteriaceae bacterium]|nr:HK97 family phage prohead protease [Methylobacteriaceae bacterium]